MNQFKPYFDELEKLTFDSRAEYPVKDRTGVGTFRVPASQMRFNCLEGFPIMNEKKIHFHSVKVELIWMLKGDTNVKFLNDNGVTIWNEWADENGDLGPVYGAQWRKCLGVDLDKMIYIDIDQISNAINLIKNDPFSRRILVNAWNVRDLDHMALPPCHYAFQFFVSNCGKYLSVSVTMRSADIFLGLPFNISSYALLLSMVAQVTGKIAYEVVFNICDLHLYANHVEQAKELISRYPCKKEPVQLWLNPEITDIDDFTIDDIKLLNYNPLPKIEAPVAI